MHGILWPSEPLDLGSPLPLHSIRLTGPLAPEASAADTDFILTEGWTWRSTSQPRLL